MPDLAHAVQQPESPPPEFRPAWWCDGCSRPQVDGCACKWCVRGLGICHHCHRRYDLRMRRGASAAYKAAPRTLGSLAQAEAQPRISTGIAEIDRVIGGGLVKGHHYVAGGEPGTGKTTTLLQVASVFKRAMIASSTDEMSEAQLAEAAKRLGTGDVLSFTGEDADYVEQIIVAAETAKVDFLVVDSLQTIASVDLALEPGTPKQIVECARQLREFAQRSGCIVASVSHVTTSDNFVGGTAFQHVVDVLLWLAIVSPKGAPKVVNVSIRGKSRTGLDNVAENLWQRDTDGRFVSLSENATLRRQYSRIA